MSCHCLLHSDMSSSNKYDMINLLSTRRGDKREEGLRQDERKEQYEWRRQEYKMRQETKENRVKKMRWEKWRDELKTVQLIEFD